MEGEKGGDGDVIRLLNGLCKGAAAFSFYFYFFFGVDSAFYLFVGAATSPRYWPASLFFLGFFFFFWGSIQLLPLFWREG